MQYFNLSETDWKEPVPGFKGRFLHSANITLVYWDVEADASLPEHSHIHEQVTNVIEGKFELTVDGETKNLGPGSVIIVPPNAVHSGKAVTNTRIIDVFYPIREDYR
jgi:quercetin dioxygenase-like cupin family protein